MEAQEHALQRAIRLGGGSMSALARLIGRTPQAVREWVTKGVPSVDGCLRIETALAGAVTRAELLPSLFGAPASAPGSTA